MPKSTTHLFLLTVALSVSASLASLCPAVTDPTQQAFVTSAKAVLDGNWVTSMNSTLPSPNLYPHQWSWDSAFIALGYSHYDTHKAIAETDALFRAQWRNGLLPHIVFNPNADESYFPGPAFWKIHTSPAHPLNSQTSGIVQPPVHAIASLAIYNNAKSAQQKKLAMHHLQSVYPKLVNWHNYLYNERDPLKENLVYIRHMWESGMDNSPAWDDALNAIQLTPDQIPQYTRVDKGKVGSHHERPNSHFYDRAVYLIKVFYDNSYDEQAIFKSSPFLIQDVLFNSILARAGEALADIAHILGKKQAAVHHREQSAKTAAAISSKLYHAEDGFYYDYDMVAKKLIRTKISGGLVALYGAKVDSTHLNSIVNHLYDPAFLGPDLSSYTIPSVARDDPGYTNTTYWKGPAWININYLVRDGLLRNGNGNEDAVKIAKFLKTRSMSMLGAAGFYEYFNPISGSPHGGHQFSWSAALTIDWMCSTSSETSPIGFVSSLITNMVRIRISEWGYVLAAVLLFGMASAAYYYTWISGKAKTCALDSFSNGNGENGSDKARDHTDSRRAATLAAHLRHRRRSTSMHPSRAD
ncbi:Glucosidase YgjK [Gracilariopsis chorda]|uniref:Glucosidase YgjK n=1 Tax=Gracilariopsis chorda TaxID=448386 RepID=A0A2V3J6P6_9FLOR|nr:Glucosidase YgjK [Gracilariopsis chorda]|eukprot:PXF50044.1 Glucosidase YgjK [Gracilariopsis chorda]